MSDSKLNTTFPYEIADVDPKVTEELLNFFHGERTGFVQVGPQRYFFPHKYKSEAESYYKFEARPSDIWIVTFPRSGTTWTQELVWLVANKLDFQTAQQRLLSERFPFFEFSLFVHPQVKAELINENRADSEKVKFIEAIDRPGYEFLSKCDPKERRFIKTHFPFSLLPPSVIEKRCKVIYVARNPLDVAVSYYHLNRLFRTQGFVGDFERYWSYFQRGLNPWMPIFNHLKEAHDRRNSENMLYLNYEEMVADLETTIKKLASFLDCKLDTNDVQNLKNHLNISNFRVNPSVNCAELLAAGVLNKNEAGFVRAGAVGGRQTEFTTNPELMANAERWIKEQQQRFEL